VGFMPLMTYIWRAYWLGQEANGPSVALRPEQLIALLFQDLPTVLVALTAAALHYVALADAHRSKTRVTAETLA